jgi:hypothetical protein
VTVALTIVSASLASAVQAQTGSEGVADEGLELVHRVEGPFDIAIAVLPADTVVGQLHLVVTVLDAETSSPVDGAVIKIVARSPDGDALEVRAVSAPPAVEEYHANLTLGSAGRWTLAVELEREGMGAVALETPLVVGEPALSAGRLGTLVWLVVIAAFFGGGLHLWRRSRAITSRR